MIEEAKQPRKSPPDSKELLALTGDQLAAELGGMRKALDKTQSIQWHDKMSEAQRLVAKFIWDKMGRYQQPEGEFVDGFLKEFNISHELVTWLRLTYIFEQFTARYRSEDKGVVMAVLCGLSIGYTPIIKAIDSRARREFLLELCRRTQRQGTTHFGDVNFEIIAEWKTLQTNPPY